MATSENLLSVKGGEKPNELDANKEDSKVQEVGGPENTWSTANYANFKFDAAVGVSPDSSIPTEVDAEKAEKLKEAEACPVCGKEPCECESLKEEGVEDEEKKDDAPVAPVAEADAPAEDENSEVASALDVDEDDAIDSDDETLELDLSDLMDDDADVVELTPSEDDAPLADDAAPVSDDEDSESEFAPTEEDKVWEDDDAEPIKVAVNDEDEDDLNEADGDQPEDEKKDELAEADDEQPEDEKKDELAEADDEQPEDEKKDELAEEDEQDAEKKDDEEKKPMAEGRLRLSFKTAEVAKLFENNTVLTEEDKRQSRVLFESAVRSVAQQLGEQLKEAYAAKFKSVKQQHEAKVAQQLDAYLSYVVEQWAKDNKVALQNQLRNRLTESFLNGFKKLCTEHYIEVPESKVNVVEALAKNVKTLKTKLKNAEAQNVKLHEEAKKAVTRERVALKNEHKARLIAEAAGAVTAAERGQFVQRAQTVKFSTTKEFKKDLIALREQYFGAKKSVERPADEPVAAPLFETKQPKSSVDAYTKIADRLTGRS